MDCQQIALIYLFKPFLLRMISFLVLTKNEESDLPGCLDSISWSNDIVVYDSCSTDATVEIAKSKKCRVIFREFDNWSSHQNWGLRNIDFVNKWVFYIDADERLPVSTIAELKKIASTPFSEYDAVAYRIKRRDFFQGKHLKHVQTSPWYIRFFVPEFISYERLVNPVTKVAGKTGDLISYLDHYPFSKGVSHWFVRHDSYSSFEALQIVSNRRGRSSFDLRLALFSSDFNVRRFHQKELFYQLPFRPFVKFLILYLLKRGFLDGKPGFTYAVLQSIYEYMIVLKVREMSGTSSKAP